MRQTDFSNEVDVAFPLLDLWRTLGGNSVSRMSSRPLRRIENRRREGHFQHIFPVRQQVSNLEILRGEDRGDEAEGLMSRGVGVSPGDLRICGTCCRCCPLGPR